MPFVYVGSSTAAQTKVAGSPAMLQEVQPPKTERKGIQVLKRTKEGQLEAVKFVELDTHVGWVAAHPSNGCLYASGNGQVRALRAHADGSLTPVGAPVDSCGNAPHLDLSADGGWVLVANYSAGTIASLPIRADGSVGPCADSKSHMPVKGTRFAELIPEYADRQASSHPHHIRLTPSGNRWAMVCDLGADTLWVYGFNAATGAFAGAANSARHLSFPEGSGPRHLDFHPSGKFVYVMCELTCEVVTCSWDGDTGALAIKASTTALPEGGKPNRKDHSGASHILCAPDGKTVYATTRGDGRVVCFSVDPLNGTLTRLGDKGSEGVCPRHFHLDYACTPPRLRVGNQDSQTIASFALDANGALDGPPEVLAIEGVCPNVVSPPYAVPPF